MTCRVRSALAVARLKDDDPFVRRAAAEVLGAHPAVAGIRPLLAIRQSTAPDDTYLIHVVRMALRDQLETPEVWSKTRHAQPVRTRRP